jgi:riboflavin synthase
MFTGIVQEKGRVVSFEEGARSWRLTVAAGSMIEDLTLGDSIAVNGCCLTATDFDARRISFDLLAETVRLTSFAGLQGGDFVNLESSLRFNGKVGGHFVTGHIDGVGEVETFEARGRDYFLRVRTPTGSGRYLIYKGSVAINGVSLTVAEADGDGFAVWLIPHTLEVTNLGELGPGSVVNLEFDLLGKYVERLLAAGTIPPTQV